jgi:hypothetical protein
MVTLVPVNVTTAVINITAAMGPRPTPPESSPGIPHDEVFRPGRMSLRPHTNSDDESTSMASIENGTSAAKTASHVERRIPELMAANANVMGASAVTTSSIAMSGSPTELIAANATTARGTPTHQHQARVRPSDPDKLFTAGASWLRSANFEPGNAGGAGRGAAHVVVSG